MIVLAVALQYTRPCAQQAVAVLAKLSVVKNAVHAIATNRAKLAYLKRGVPQGLLTGVAVPLIAHV